MGQVKIEVKKMEKMKRIKTRKTKEPVHWSPLKILLLVGLLIYAVCLFIPMIWAVITAFKAQPDFRINVIGLPKEWVWNFETVFKKFYVTVMTDLGTVKVGMAKMFLNALLYAFGCAYFGTLVPCITSYLCARFNQYKLSKIIPVIVIITMVLPIVGNLPSEINVSQKLGLYDHIWGLWLMKAHFLGMYFLVFFNMYKALPMAYTEAAQIDGASNWYILTRIILPITKNSFFTVMLINFITYWNDYQTPLIYLPSYPTIALGMYQMAYTLNNELSVVPMRMAAALLMLTPILILFLCFHKRLLGNLTMGGIKG